LLGLPWRAAHFVVTLPVRRENDDAALSGFDLTLLDAAARRFQFYSGAGQGDGDCAREASHRRAFFASSPGG